MENLKPAAEAIQAADAILIGASNGLSITDSATSGKNTA